MSALADKLHNLVTRLRGAGEVEVHHLEEVVAGLEEHLVPAVRKSVDEAVTAALAEVRTLVEEGRAAEQRLLVEVKRDLAKLAGATVSVDAAATAAPAIPATEEASKPAEGA